MTGDPCERVDKWRQSSTSFGSECARIMATTQETRPALIISVSRVRIGEKPHQVVGAAGLRA